MYKLVISSFEEHMEFSLVKQGGSEIWVQLYFKTSQQGFTKPYAFQKREQGFEFLSIYVHTRAKKLV